MSENVSSVFISYAHDDATDVAKWLSDSLQQLGHTVFWDREALQNTAGTDWELRIEEAIRQTESVLALLTPKAIRPVSVCRNEISYALNNKRVIIPALVIKCQLPLRLQGLHYIDLESFTSSTKDTRDLWINEIDGYLRNGLPDDPGLDSLRSKFQILDYSHKFSRDPRDPFVGREWLHQKINEWVTNPDSPATLFVTGGPGVGKSRAIAKWIDDHLHVGAYHFCDVDVRTDAGGVTSSLAGQLVKKYSDYPEYSDVLKQLYPDLPAAISSWTPVQCFRKLIIEPLRNGRDGSKFVIVVDGLDEALPEVQDMFSDGHSHLPPGVKLLITSRPDWTIMSRFRNRLELDAASTENLNDLKEYANTRLTQFPGRSTAEQTRFANRLIEASNGSFLYCSEVLNSVRDGDIQVSDAAVLPSGHSGVYSKYLQRCFATISTDHETAIRTILQTVLAAKEVLNNRALVDLTGLRLDEVEKIRRSLGTLLSDPDNWRFFHKSFEDWLKTDPFNPYGVDLTSGHEAIVNTLQGKNDANEFLRKYRLRWKVAHLLELAAGTKVKSHYEAACDLLTSFSELKSRVMITAQTPSGHDNSSNSIGEIVKDMEILTTVAFGQDWDVPHKLRIWQGLFLRFRELWSKYPEEFHQDCLNVAKHEPEFEVPQIETQRWLVVENQEYFDHQNNLKYFFRDSSCASFSPNEDYVAIGGTDGALRLVETNTGALLWYRKVHISKIHSVTISPDGQHVLTAADDNMACLWCTRSGQVVEYLWGHNAALVKATFTTYGRHIMTASEDREIRIWSATDGKPFKVFSDTANVVGASNISSDGQMLVTVFTNHIARIQRVETGEVLKDLIGHTDNVVAALFSPDDSQIMTYSLDRTARIWNVQTGAEVLTIVDHLDPVSCATFSLDGSKIVTASSSSIKIWSLSTGKCVRTLSGHTKDVTYVKFSHDTTLLISVAMDRTVRVWDVAKNQQIDSYRVHWGEITRCDISRDSNLLLSNSSDVTSIWDMNSQSAKSGMHDDQIKFVNVSPDGNHVLSASDDGIVKLWDTNDFSLVSTIEANSGPFKSVIFSPCGRKILTASIDKTVSIWDTATGGKSYSTGKLDYLIKSVIYSPCGSTFLTLHNEVVQVWDANCNPVASLTSDDEFDDVGEFVSALYSPDGLMIVTASTDYTSRVWCVQSGVLKATFLHEDEVTSASFGIDNRYVITSSIDFTAKLWDVDTRTLVQTFRHKYEVRCAVFSPDNRFIVTLTSNGVATIWNCEDGTEVSVVRDCYSIDSVVDPEGVLLSIRQLNIGSNQSQWKQEQVLYRWNDGFRVRNDDPTQCSKHPTLLNIDHNNGYSLTVRGAKANKQVITHLETSSLAGCAKILPNNPQSFVVGSYDGSIRFFSLQGGVANA